MYFTLRAQFNLDGPLRKFLTAHVAFVAAILDGILLEHKPHEGRNFCLFFLFF